MTGALLASPGRADDAAANSGGSQYTLEIDGQSISLTPDQPVELEGQFRNPKVVLRVSKTRPLQAAGVEFEYPSNFVFEAETEDKDVQTWTMAGNDITLILFNFTEKVDPRTLAESTADALESTQFDVEPVSMKLGDADRSGVKAVIKLGTQTLIQHVLTLPETDSGSRLLVIQEVRAEGEGESKELQSTLKLVDGSLQIKP